MRAWYYYDHDDQKQGPVTSEQLEEIARRGMITTKTLVVLQSGKRESRYPLLYVAVSEEDIEFTQFLVSLGADVNAEIEYGGPPLHWAAWSNKNTELTKFLISQGADIHAQSKNGWTPLHRTGENRYGNLELARFFISQGADIHAKGEEGKTPLHCAVRRKENFEVAKFLISEGVDVNVKDNNGDTPLHESAVCYRGNVEAVNFLISHGADVNVKNKDGETPLHQACIQFVDTNAEIVKSLVLHGADVNAKNEDDMTPLYRAVASFCKDLEVVKFLVSYGAEVDIKTKSGITPLRFAKSWNNMEAAKYLSGLTSTATTPIKLQAMIDIVRNLGSTVDDVLENVTKNLLAIFPRVDCAFICLNDEQTGQLEQRTHIRRDAKNSESEHINRTILEKVVGSKTAFLSHDVTNDVRFKVSENNIRAIMVVPIMNLARTEVFGVIQVDSRTPGRKFTSKDLDLLGSLANLIAVECQIAKLKK